MRSHVFRKGLFYALLPILIGTTFFLTPVKTDLSAFFVAGDTEEETLLANEMQSGALSRRYILSIVAPSNKPIPASTDFDALIEAFASIQGVESVWRPEQSRATLQALGELYAPHAAQIYALAPRQALDERLSEQGLAQTALLLRTALLSPQAALIKPIARQDPLLLSLNGFRNLEKRWRANTSHEAFYQNLFLDSQASGLDADAQRRIRAEIEARFADWNRNANPGYRLEMTGVPVFAAATQSLIETDLARIGMLSSVALALLFLWLFRSLRSLLHVGAILLATIACAILATVLAFGYIHGLTLAIGSTLGGVCIDYCLHGLVHGQSVPPNRRAGAIARIWPSMAMGAITTCVGYAVLGFSGYPGFKQIAVYSATAIASALFFARFVLPSLITDLPTLTKAPRKGMLERWMDFCARHRARMVIALILVLGLATANLSSLRWIDDLQNLTPELDFLKGNDRAIRERIVSIEPGRFILIRAGDAESALQKAESMVSLLEELKQEGRLEEYFGLYPWLLSKRQQQINAELLHQYLSQQTLNRWHSKLREQGLSVELLGKLDYANPQSLTPDQLLASPLKPLIDSQIAIHPGKVLVTIWLGKHDVAALKSRLTGLEGVVYFSQRDLLNRLTAEYTRRAVLLSGAGILAVFGLLWLGYRSPKTALQTLLPSLSAVLIIAGLWPLTGQPLSFLHLTAFLLAISICDDFGIFFGENRGGEIALTYRAMAASMLTTALAFACLAVAQTSMLRTLALVVGLGVVLGFLLCPVLIKPSDRVDA